MPPKNKNKILKLGDQPINSRIFGYVRVSTEKQQEEGQSIQAQKSRIEEYCKYHNLVLTEPKFYEDIKSGKSIEKRKGLKALLNNLQSGDVYIFPNVSRLGRSTGDNISVLKQLTAAYCKLIILDLQINTTTDSGNGMFQMFSVVSEMERNFISQRTREIMQFMKKKGKLLTKPSFGYQIGEVNGKKCMVKSLSEQIIIKFIRESVINKPNITLAAIIRLMRENNMTLRKGKLYHEGITAILAREGFIKPKFSHTWRYTNTNEDIYKNTEKYVIKQ